MSGIIIIDKPPDWTSHDVVAKLRGALKIKRIGHGGTLDPMATGVLPIFIGRATRAAEFCENAKKEYIAGIKFGIVTDTQDITGNVLRRDSANVTADELRSVLPGFLGRQKQIPPMYSAIKQNGKKLYELARRGEEVERPGRDIEIFELEVIETPPENDDADASDFYLRVSCSKGTYVRTLCNDIGTALGCGATLSYLRRTKAGVFTIDKAHTLDEVIETYTSDAVGAACNRPPVNILPVDSIFAQYPSITLSDTDTRKAKNGALRCLSARTASLDGKYRFYSQGGEFLLFGEISGGNLKVIKNFFEL